ncbi:MAG: TonB family protein [Novosphingobium sp.]
MVVDFISLDGRHDSEQPAIRPKSNRSLPAPAIDPRTVTVASTVLGPTAGDTTTATPSDGDSVSTLPGEAGGTLSSTASTALNDYQRLLYEIVARHSRYPSEAGKLRLAGVTCLAFRLDRNGNVLDRWIEHSSGSALLDKAALAALERAQPLPPIPPSLPARLDFIIEIDSSLQQVALQGAN